MLFSGKPAMLGFMIDEDTRTIIMVRWSIDATGKQKEQSSTKFHEDAWLDMTDEEWETFKQKVF